jgi:cytochrome oxidase Cu insertion factor (SCO1/SenC/PrrC family)
MRYEKIKSARRQRGFLSSRQGLVLLGLLFMTPAFVSWVMHNSSEEGWRPDGTTNRGVLVHPARTLTLPADMQVADVTANDYLQGKWTILYIGDADCDDVCSNNLYKMRQVRIAQNEHMKRVQTLYMVLGDEFPASLREQLEKEHTSLDIAIVPENLSGQIAADFLVDGVSMDTAERVYYIDPLGNLMMYYPADANAGGMLKDLKKLLKYSKIG